MTNKVYPKIGDSVMGSYHGVSFNGTVLEYRHHTMRYDLLIITVKLEPRIKVYGTERDIILIDFFSDGKVNPDACIKTINNEVL